MGEAKHYSYRMDHDTGFAPHTQSGVCTLCGCKTTSIERWAKAGSWVVGIGGNNTGKPNMLIYAMRVKEALPFREFRKRYRKQASYYDKHKNKTSPDAPILVADHFYYFGDRARCLPDLPDKLSNVIHRGRGCKLLTDDDIALLNKRILCRYACGERGDPNNPPDAFKPRMKPVDKAKGNRTCKSSC